ncbi:hypothetical protein V1478_008084 [Vespula squamosa]|uniref:Uncharacterized protein n=1 Tax=Vespula squamosa TaxID=30214 RepID=A0ABD2AXS2_VESSQ
MEAHELESKLRNKNTIKDSTNYCREKSHITQSSPQLQDVIIVPVKYTNKDRTCALTRYGNRMLWFTGRPKWMTGHSAILALWFRLPETSFCRETGKRLAEFKDLQPRRPKYVEFDNVIRPRCSPINLQKSGIKN